ncbi:YraN family protein [Rhodopirellula sallentina]|uniref:YraN family protein n=1 Tax=Rhodopirellula sallentina TaxID=1263869 RepID=UPI001F22D84D|nr:YraN family protein [Rhodopirellula sallentina]
MGIGNIVERILPRGLRASYERWRYGTFDPDAVLGKRGEQVAAIELRRKGLRVIAESESDRAGEIDLIALDRRRRIIVFVEVKTLGTRRPGHPADRVDEKKQSRISKAALRYLKRNGVLGNPCRFDVVAVWWPSDEATPTKIEHYEAAFESTIEHAFY